MAEAIILFCAMVMIYLIVDRCLKCIERCSRYKWYYGKNKFYADFDKENEEEEQ